MATIRTQVNRFLMKLVLVVGLIFGSLAWWLSQ